jgi:hypothetical protein
MHPDVGWLNGIEGGRVSGPDNLRQCETRQSSLIHPRVESLGIVDDPGRRTVLRVGTKWLGIWRGTWFPTTLLRMSTPFEEVSWSTWIREADTSRPVWAQIESLRESCVRNPELEIARAHGRNCGFPV